MQSPDSGDFSAAALFRAAFPSLSRPRVPHAFAQRRKRRGERCPGRTRSTNTTARSCFSERQAVPGSAAKPPSRAKGPTRGGETRRRLLIAQLLSSYDARREGIIGDMRLATVSTIIAATILIAL